LNACDGVCYVEVDAHRKRWMNPLAALGLVAILALLGVLGFLPDGVAFFTGSLAIILFPGVILTTLIAPSGLQIHTLPERVVVWFVVGTGLLAALGLVGLLVHASLSHLVLAAVAGYASATIMVLAKKMPGLAGKDRDSSAQQDRGWVITAILPALAVGAALLTLLSQRDSDDWYYLAYIRDYVANHPLGVEDAILGMGNPATPRLWFGGAWWILEALLSKVTGVDPVAFHQVFLPLLVLPFAVFAVFLFSRQVFRSGRTALLASVLQVLFYLSSVFPYKSGGWMLFCRTAQDKTISCFVMVPVAAALAIRFARVAPEGAMRKKIYALYCTALLASVLIHPLGLIWCCLFIIPYALVEYLRHRCSSSARLLIVIVLPFLVCGSFLAFGRGQVVGDLEAEESKPGPATGVMSSLYFPGEEVSSITWKDPPPETSHTVTWTPGHKLRICNPLYITRYPLAIAGLVLSFALIPYLKSHSSARLLACLTFSILFFAFTPLGAAATAGLATWTMVYRLTWVFPWGLIIAFWLSRSRLKPLWIWLIVLTVTIALARGNPQNYAEALSSRRMRNRPSPEAVDALRFLGREPSPQGVILASAETGRMIAAFLPDAYPATYRGTGLIDGDSLKDLLKGARLDKPTVREIRRKQVRYVLLEKELPLAEVLNRRASVFSPIYQNDIYRIWKVEQVEN
jgi:hypothetical protein